MINETLYRGANEAHKSLDRVFKQNDLDSLKDTHGYAYVCGLLIGAIESAKIDLAYVLDQYEKEKNKNV